MTILAAAASAAAAVAIALPSAGAGAGGHAGHDHGSSSQDEHVSRELATSIAKARFALAPYTNDLAAAQAAGYKMQITQMMPGMGFHYMNPDVKDFDVTRPPILVYVKQGDKAQLVAAEWVF